MHEFSGISRVVVVLIAVALCTSVAFAASKTTPAPTPEKRMVALTFDDGPSKANTPRILDTLERYGARATFFVIGQNILGNESILQRASALGCEIGNHTWDHKKLTELNTEQIREQLRKTDDAVSDAIGLRPLLVRAPCGRYGCSACSALDRPVVLWSVDPRDWSYGTERKMNTEQNRSIVICAATENVKDGDIILLHDLYAFTAQCCEEIIPQLQKQGFSLVTVSELMQNRGVEMQAGTTYRRVPKE